MRIERLVAAYEVEVLWTHFPLHPEIPQGGMTIESLFVGREAYINEMRQRLEDLFAAAGLPYGRLAYLYNTRLSQELGKWAESQPGGAAIHNALFRAYFVDALAVDDVEVLVEIAASVGLPAKEARRVVDKGEYATAVDRDWQRSVGMGVTGVPTFVANRLAVVGAQPYEHLEGLVQRAGARPRG